MLLVQRAVLPARAMLPGRFMVLPTGLVVLSRPSSPDFLVRRWVGLMV
jgi:hypothetical protein